VPAAVRLGLQDVRSHRGDPPGEQPVQHQVPRGALPLTAAPHPRAWGLHAGQGAAILNTSDPILELSTGGENPLHFAKEELKVSGLVPKPMEAKLQQTAYRLREKRGKGTVILFSGNPVFRASTPFTTRAFLNAIFFGSYRVEVED